MSVQSEIDRITQNVADTYSALEEKGATMPAEQNSDNLPATARTVPAGGTTGLSAQADWNQTDETAADFIKNKPFGEFQTVLYEGTDLAPMDEEGAYVLELPTFEIVEGYTYSVVIDGVKYATESVPIYGVFYIVGNPSIMGGDDNGLPFVCMLNADTGTSMIFVAFVPFTSLTISTIEVHKIDEKYIPTEVIILYRNNTGSTNDPYLYRENTGAESDRVTLDELRSFVESGRTIYVDINTAWYQPVYINVSKTENYGRVKVIGNTDDFACITYYTAEYTP